ncbi:MAG: hemerythrin family protein [Spirochaetes bacterium]|nr:hemerythrin family protein [Spirochaetota bacterium]
MQQIEWNDSFSVGVNKFNDDHKQLIIFVNKLNHALQIKSTQQTMEEILNGLVNYTKIHFKNEETAMIKYSYPDYTSHKDEHDKLTSQVIEFTERLHSGKASFSIELMDFLSSWLMNHIQKTDMDYKAFFQDKEV